uniref:DUF834 domain-containing protein n=1 Tax=Oryza brachyantha TaxID=4533 RepID=J3KXS7_ORYBR
MGQVAGDDVRRGLLLTRAWATTTTASAGLGIGAFFRAANGSRPPHHASGRGEAAASSDRGEVAASSSRGEATMSPRKGGDGVVPWMGGGVVVSGGEATSVSGGGGQWWRGQGRGRRCPVEEGGAVRWYAAVASWRLGEEVMLRRAYV